MNAYVVYINEMRDYVEPVLDDGSGPAIPIWPVAPVVAETEGKAKWLFLNEYSHRPRTGVETDDWVSLRVRLIAKDIQLLPGETAGVKDEDNALWCLVPYNLHGGDDD